MLLEAMESGLEGSEVLCNAMRQADTHTRAGTGSGWIPEPDSGQCMAEGFGGEGGERQTSGHL